VNSMPGSSPAAIGIMGGTFDPVHLGHLRTAIEFAESFSLQEVRLLPSRYPPHRQTPHASPEDRRQMLMLAVEGVKGLFVDEYELRQHETSYTVRTLQQLRNVTGESVPIYFALGGDAFLSIETWQEWKTLFSLANFVVVSRPGSLVEVNHDFLRQRVSPFSGTHTAAGAIHFLPVTGLEISSTEIRKRIAADKSIHFLLPDAVESYIHQHKLYR
jgi:nicotinate-nucleotide adenylyltransferase